MTIIYHEHDGDLSVLEGKRIAVVGYGNLGRPLALNMRDSGVNVAVGARDDTTAEQARRDGFTSVNIEDAVADAQIIMLMMPDEVMPEVYIGRIAPHLERGDMLVFGSGYNVAFGFVEAPPFVDVGLIAPRTLGAVIRERYLAGQGFYSFVSVGQDASGQAWPHVLALAKACGSLKAGAVEVSMEQEAELDLFMQQVILPVFHQVILTAGELLLKQGYPPEAALTDLYLSGELIDYLSRASRNGIMQTLQLTSMISQYGVLSRLDRFHDVKLERLMELSLDEIRRGSFAREWSKEFTDGYPRLRKLLKQHSENDVWEMEQQTLERLKPFDE
jgi:ketol-acid reductoisomerase